ncbi:hypothetical protein V6N13_033749 [Hibiscus sabdariffa]|uniref:Uncharacterized protein n=1 Tax=Hibiscus sabdariffa TaxID=183260 RepID=A0ABR2F9L2_9ROSI
MDPADSHQIGSRTSSFTAVWAATWPRRWEQIGGATNVVFLPVIGAVWAHETPAKEACRRRLDGSGHLGGFGGRGDGSRSRTKATSSPQADASKKSFGHNKSDWRRVWCGMNRFGRIPIGGSWYGDDVRISGLGLSWIRVDVLDYYNRIKLC